MNKRLWPHKRQFSPFLVVRAVLPVVLVLTTVLAGPVLAQVYKWTDPETGKQVMSNTPPPSNIKGQVVQRAPATEQEKNTLSPSASKAGAADEKKPVSDQNSALCSSTRQNIALLDSGQPVEVDGKTLDDAGRVAQLARARDILRLFCK